MFRFKQKLAQILGGRELNSAEQAGLDAYDIELEDALSNTSSSGDSLWTYSGGDLSPTTAPTQDFLVAADRDVSLFSNRAMGLSATNNVTIGSDVGAVEVRAFGGQVRIKQGAPLLTTFIHLEGTGDVDISADGDVSLTATGNILFNGLPTSDPGVSGAIYSLLGVLHISP